MNSLMATIYPADCPFLRSALFEPPFADDRRWLSVELRDFAPHLHAIEAGALIRAPVGRRLDNERIHVHPEELEIDGNLEFCAAKARLLGEGVWKELEADDLHKSRIQSMIGG